MLYFAHDIDASLDPKIVALRLTCGGAAVDAFWYLVEQMHKEESGLRLLNNPVGSKVVCHWLATDEKTLETWLNTMIELELFEVDLDGETVFSERVMEQVSAYNKKAETARQNGKKGGRKPSRNRVGSNRGTQPLTEEKKRKEKRIGFSPAEKKPIQGTVASRAEDGAEAKSQVCPHCAKCGNVAKFNARSMCFICPTCGELRGKEEVTFE